MQIADVIPLEIDGQIAFFRVTWLEYVRDTSFFERTLDIADSEIASQVVKNRVKVTELSFNERRGYLCHKSSLE